MTISHLLEAFEGAGANGATGLSMEDSLADHELEVFESGYKAGWDDCHKAALTSGSALSEDFAQNLRELTFTYQEAYTAVIRSLEPLVCQLVGTVLEGLDSESLSKKINSEVTKIAKSHAGCTVHIICHPRKLAMLKSALPRSTGLTITLGAESTFSEGQINLRFVDSEREIDTSAFATQVRTLIQSYFDDLNREPIDG